MTRGIPGHMQKGKLAIIKYAKVLDCCLLVLDSRAPHSTWDRRVAARFEHKLVVVLNKASLADPLQTQKWVSHLAAQGYTALGVDAKEGIGMGALRRILESKISGRRPLRVAAVGLPNTGKSTILNYLLGRRATKVGNKPGITRGPQWVRIGKLEILDTPGVLTGSSSLKSPTLAALGVVDGESELTASWLLSWLMAHGPKAVLGRYDLRSLEPGGELEAIARKQGWLRQGAQPDLSRAAVGVLADFQSGKLGRWTIEEP